MTNTLKLEKAISESGLKKNHLAKKLGISRYALSLKINNENSFKAEEMYTLIEAIGLDETKAKSIFFDVE